MNTGNNIPYLDCRINAGDCAVIEAAAGTGKTYNITNIVARLIMERADAAIDKMVIVTFTRAAAGELKSRISQRLAELEKAVDSPDPQDELLKLVLEKGIPAEEIKRRLRPALLNFDRAMIGTIHSFAMRALSENSFHSRLKFDFSLNENTPAVIKEFCNDYYRTLFYRKDFSLLKGQLKKKLIEDYCLKLMADPGLKVQWPDLGAFPESSAPFDALPGLYNEMFAGQQHCIDAGDKTGAKAAEKRLKQIFTAIQKAVCENALVYVTGKYNALCSEKNFIGNDDLILKMASSLNDENFLRQLQEVYSIGLIDEFQDTNNSQFEIFRKIFLENSGSTFIVVGDPRQAIYRFRNCDIKTYLEAKKLMLTTRGAQFFTMNTNRRSGEKYISQLNAIFTPRGSFAMDEMDMPEQTAVENSKVLLTPEGREIDTPIQAAVAPAMKLPEIFRHCAADIYDLIKRKYMLPSDPPRPVTFGDIAILTNGSWAQAAGIRDELRKYGIPVRLMKNPNVFKTPEALQLLTFLEGILNISNNAALLRALITPLSDLTLDNIKSDEAVEIRAGWMQELHALWHKRSFMVMYNELLVRFNVTDRLSRMTGGDRMLSNFNTMADILCEEEFSRKSTPLALLNVLQKHIDHADTENSYPGRAETDQGTVLIDTIFGSKGLAYPVVFLPDLFYMGKSFNSDRISGTFHNEAGELCYAPVGDKNAAEIEHNEMIQENLRKAYVAFTRAGYYCRFYCGDPGKTLPKCAPTDWLFRSHGISEYTGLYSQLTGAAKKTPLTFPMPAEVLTNEVAGASFEAPEPARLRRSDLMPPLVSNSGFLSFSSITPHGASMSTLAPEKDDEEETDPMLSAALQPSPEPPPETMLLPSGTGFGNAVHKVMELCSYDDSPESLREYMALQLRVYGLAGEKVLQDSVKMLYHVLNAPIPDCDGGIFTLAEIGPERRLCEFEFLYEFGNTFHTGELFRFAADYFGKRFSLRCPLPAEESSMYDAGFFNGSIDLFFRHNGKFYILDWKTNKLDSISAYSPEQLPAAMANNRYYVQYMIYTAALFKYLRQRMDENISDEDFYDKYMGGVRYVFLRGTYEKGNGVFGDRLPYKKFKELEEIIG